MTRMSAELKVGLFALAVLAVLAFMTFRVGGLRIGKKEGYVLYADFDNTVGLDTRTRVKVAGVNAGVVEKISLVGDHARLTLRMDPSVRVRADAEASIRALGLLGDKYLALSQGSETAPYLKDGDVIARTRPPTDYDQLVSNLSRMSAKFARVADSLNRLVGDEGTRAGLLESLRKITDLADNLNRAVTANEAKLSRLLDRVSELTTTMNAVLLENRESLARVTRGMDDVFNERAPRLMDELETSAREIRTLVADLREPALRSIRNIEKASATADEALQRINAMAGKVDRGEGTLGKLMTDEELYDSINRTARGLGNQLDRFERMRVFVEFQAEQLTGIGDAKGRFHLKVQPSPTKYYLLGLVTDPRGSTRSREIVRIDPDGTEHRSTETTTERKLEFTAMIAKRFSDLVFRGGLLENSFGLGLDYMLFDDRLALSTEVWDFGKDEYLAEAPHLRVGLDFRPFRYLILTAGYDNILNSRTEGVYFGGGIRFEDEDLKYMFGAIPAVPVD